MSSFPIGEQSNFVRNQLTKDFLAYISRDGAVTKATVIYDKDTKQTIDFNNDHPFAWQDV